MISGGKYSPGRMFSGRIFSGGRYSPGQIISGHMFSGRIFSGVDVLGAHIPSTESWTLCKSGAIEAYNYITEYLTY